MAPPWSFFRRVVVFGVDGVPASVTSHALSSTDVGISDPGSSLSPNSVFSSSPLLENLSMPVLRSLYSSRGTSASVRSEVPTLSLANWASAFSGVPATFHGIKSNDWNAADKNTNAVKRQIANHVYCDRSSGEDDASSTPWCARSPTLFEVLAEKNLLGKVVYNWCPLDRVLPSEEHAECVAPYRAGCSDARASDAAVVGRAIELIEEDKHKLVWAVIQEVDECAHRHGLERETLERADSLLGQVLDALGPSAHNDTLVIVMSDHGRDAQGYHHGGFTQSELETRWVFAGRGVRASSKVASPMSIIDLAPTILAALDVPAPSHMRGRAFREIWDKSAHAPLPPARVVGMPCSAYDEPSSTTQHDRRVFRHGGLAYAAHLSLVARYAASLPVLGVGADDELLSVFVVGTSFGALSVLVLLLLAVLVRRCFFRRASPRKAASRDAKKRQ